MKNLLNSNLKDHIIPKNKSGIYQINCKNCEKTKRDLETREKEHIRNIKNGEVQKLAVTAHVWKRKHAMDCKPVILKQVSIKQGLNRENILTTKTRITL